MTKKGDKRTFKNADLTLQVTTNIDPKTWDESKYESFLDELCGHREYQKDAIRVALRFLLSGKYNDLRALAKENFDKNEELQERFGSWKAMQEHLQLPNQLSCSIDQATGTGKSYVLYGLAVILLAEGVVDRVLVLCPSNTIEDGLLTKFKELAGKDNIRDSLPNEAKIRTPTVINASESIVAGAVCVENYHAILENTKSSIRQSLKGKGSRTAVLNDEAHHIANERGANSKKWKEFLEDKEYGFRFVVGVSGTCYVDDEYFSDVVHRYSLRQAIEERFVKQVEYVAEMPPAAEKSEERWQIIHNRHKDWVKKLKSRGIRPLTIVVTKNIAEAENVADEIIEFLVEHEKLKPEQAAAKVLCVTSATKHQANVAKLKLVDKSTSPVEWIVSVAMLSEGWDVKNVFQIVPHEERAFNSRLLIGQVLGRGLRRPDGWTGEEPLVTVFNHDSWSARIKQIVDEILEIERRITSIVNPKSPFNFTLHNLNYTRDTDTTTFTKKGPYNLFADGYVDLPTQIESENVSVKMEHAVSGKQVEFRTRITHKTWTVDEVAEHMYQRLKSLDDENRESKKKSEHTNYSKQFPRPKCVAVIEESLKRAKIKSSKVTDDNRQKLLQAIGPLHRKESKRVVYKLNPKALVTLSTSARQTESCSAAELRKKAKSLYYGPGCEATLIDEQKEFFTEVCDPDGDFSGEAIEVKNAADFKTPVNLAIADAKPERKFIRELVTREYAQKIDAWLKSTPIGFYWIEYAWKKGNTPKRGEFSPDFFIKQEDNIFIIEIKDDKEITDPSPENIKKYEYAVAHVGRLNEWLARDKGNKVKYHFNMMSPKSYPAFFECLLDGTIVGFRSDLDVAMAGAGKGG